MHILFDLDGTLIDSTEAILESFHHAFSSHTTPVPSSTDITALIGHPLDVMFLRLGIETHQVDMYVHSYKLHYRKISRAKTTLLPNAHQAVIAASEFAHLGIVTTKTARYSRELLEHFEIMHHFDVLIGREDVIHPKPHPEPIHKAMEVLNCDPSRCWMIGDTRLDIEAATSAGIASVAVLSGYDGLEQLSSITDKIEKDALDAVKFVAKNTSIDLAHL